MRNFLLTLSLSLALAAPFVFAFRSSRFAAVFVPIITS